MEQVTYSPCAMVSFYFGMSLLEGKTVEEAKKEVEKKFLPTYKVHNNILWFFFSSIKWLLTKKIFVVKIAMLKIQKKFRI